MVKCFYCFPQRASTCFRCQISISSTGLRFTLTPKTTRPAPATVTAVSLTAAQTGWKTKASWRRLERYRRMERPASETQYNTHYTMTPHQMCRQTVRLNRLTAPHTFKCQVPSQLSTNCLFIYIYINAHAYIYAYIYICLCKFGIFLSHQSYYNFS